MKTVFLLVRVQKAEQLPFLILDIVPQLRFAVNSKHLQVKILLDDNKISCYEIHLQWWWYRLHGRFNERLLSFSN